MMIILNFLLLKNNRSGRKVRNRMRDMNLFPLDGDNTGWTLKNTSGVPKNISRKY